MRHLVFVVFILSLATLGTGRLAVADSGADSVADSSAAEAGDNEAVTELDSLFTNKNFKPKASATDWPKDVSQDLTNDLAVDPEDDSSSDVATGPETQQSSNGNDDADREIASATKWKKKKAPAKKQLKAKPKTSPQAPVPVVHVRSHLPKGVRNGFEIRVKAAGVLTSFMVIQRGIKQDLLYANSSGSRASIALSPANFRVLQAHAVKIPQSTLSTKICANNSMQIHIVTNGVARTSNFCVNAKSAGAEKLRNLGNTLVVWVR